MTSELRDKIKNIIKEVIGNYRLEINDEITHFQIKHDVERAIQDKCDFKLNKIQSFKVVCDSTNNSYIDIDNGKVNIHVYLSGVEENNIKVIRYESNFDVSVMIELGIKS